MNRSDLIKHFAESQGISAEEATTLVSEFFGAIRNALVAGDRVEIRGFGTFVIKDYRGYAGRNPRSGDTVTVAPKRLPFFRAGKKLKDYLNQK
jgi:integration host factor subunit beta